MPSTTQTLPSNAMKQQTPQRTNKAAPLQAEKPHKLQKPTKWGEQLLVKMEALRKALAA